MGTLGGAGASGLSDLLPLATPVSSDGSLAQQANNDQPTVEAMLKERMQDSAGWQDATNVGYAGLPSGTPLIVGLLAKLAEQFTGVPASVWVNMWTADPDPANLETIVQDALASIFTVSVNIQTLLGSLNFLDPDFDADAAWETIITVLLNPLGVITAIFEPDDDLLADIRKLYQSIIEYNVNVLVNPLLETAESMEADEDWSWDDTIRHVPTGGSATVTGDSELHERGSDPILPVAPGQNIAAYTWVRWRDVACVGPAFELVLYRYDGNEGETAGLIGEETLESFSDPVEDSANIFDSDFIKLDGNYTIAAEDTETKGVRLVWRVTENVTAGQSWWHDASMTKANDDFNRKMQNIDIDGNFDLTKVFNQLPAEQVEGVGGTPDLGTSVTDTWNAFWNGIFGLVETGKTAEDMQTAAASVSTTANTALYSTETQAGFFLQPRTLPAWIGSLADDVSFDTSSIDGTSTTLLGTIYLIPVTITSDRTIDAVKFGLTTSGMTNLKIGVYDCDESTGELNKVIDLGDRKADIDLAFAQQTFELDEPVSVQDGELYYISVLQVGGTASPMHRDSRTTNFTNGLFPKHLGSTWSTTGVSTLPSTIDNADVAAGTRYWGALGTAAEPVAPGGLFLSDSFNRADSSSSVGPQWTIRNGAGGIYQNRPLAVFLNEMTVTNNTRLLSTTQRVGFTKINKSNDNACSVTLRGNGFGPCAELIVSDSDTPSVGIYTRTGYSPYDGFGFSTRTSRASASLPTVAGSWIFEAVGNVYRGYLAGVLKVQWTDSGGAFTVASNNTEVGFWNEADVGPGVIDDWYAQDI